MMPNSVQLDGPARRPSEANVSKRAQKVNERVEQLIASRQARAEQIVAENKAAGNHVGVRTGRLYVAHAHNPDDWQYVHDLVYLPEDLALMRQYSGSGGMGKLGASGAGLLQEFYTPVEIARACLRLAHQYGWTPGSGTVIEPSCGVGNFLHAVSEVSADPIDAFELNPVSALIAEVLYPQAFVSVGEFECHFIQGKRSVGDKLDGYQRYSLAVGNPPFGKYFGRCARMGEAPKYGKTLHHYFLRRCADLLQPGGVLVFVMPASYLANAREFKDDKQALLEKSGVEFVDAYRLWNGALYHTEELTDLVVFRKLSADQVQPTAPRLVQVAAQLELLQGNRWFERNPDKVLGQATGRFDQHGRPQFSGELSSLSRIAPTAQLPRIQPDKRGALIAPAPAGAAGATPPQAIPADVSTDRAKKPATARSNRQVANTTTQRMPSPEGTQTVPFEQSLKALSAGISDQALQAWLYCHREWGRPYLGGWTQVLRADFDPEQALRDGTICIDPARGQGESPLTPAPIYYSQNIYRRIAQLKDAKDEFVRQYGQEQYDRQLQGLAKVMPPPLNLSDPAPENRLQLHPLSRLASEIKIMALADGSVLAEQGEGMTLKQAFMVWLEGRGAHEFEREVSAYQINNYYMRGRNMTAVKEEDRFAVKRDISLEAVRLMARFLHEALLREDQQRVEHIWNSTLNNWRDVDPAAVPIAFEHGYAFGASGSPTQIRPAQREGVAFALAAQGSSITAFDVGVGKTMTAMALAEQVIEMGWARRPLIIAPKSVYPKWLKELRGEEGFNGFLPHRPVLALGNLGEQFLSLVQDADGATVEVPAGHISVMTYEGFERLGFSEQSYERVKNDLVEIIDQAKEQSAGKAAKERSKLEQRILGLFGTTEKDTVAQFEALGFDYLIIDEAHNFKNIFTTVEGEQDQDDDAMSVRLRSEGYRRMPQGGSGDRTRRQYTIQGTMSIRGVRALIASLILHDRRARGQWGGVQLLTATPFTNSPLEIYSMLALVAYRQLKQRGIANLKAFFDSFIRVEYDVKYTARQKLEQGQVIRGFNNRIALQDLLFSNLIYKTGEDAGITECGPESTTGLCRPRKVVLPRINEIVDGQLVPLPEDQQVLTFLRPTEEQKLIMEEISSYTQGKSQLFQFCEIAKGTCSEGQPEIFSEEQYELDWQGKDIGRYLRAISYQRNAALSPMLYNCRANSSEQIAADPKRFVETSPKLAYIFGCIASVKAHYAATGARPAGQIVYMNAAVCAFPALLDYAVKEMGYSPSQVAYIEGTDAFVGYKRSDRERVRDAFNQGDVLLLFGSATIREGIDLQTNGAVLYIAHLDWNPTDLRQVEGRIWRQGNRHQAVRIVIPLLENSVDAFMFQKLEEKTARINDLFNRAGRGNVLRLEEINPEEVKYGLITDLKARAELELKDEAEQIRRKAVRLDSRLATLKELSGARDIFARFYPMFDYLANELGPLKDVDGEVNKALEAAQEEFEQTGYSPRYNALNSERAQLVRKAQVMVIEKVTAARAHAESVGVLQNVDVGPSYERRMRRLAEAVRVYEPYLTYENSVLGEQFEAFKRAGSVLRTGYRTTLEPLGFTVNDSLEAVVSATTEERVQMEKQAADLLSEQALADRLAQLTRERDASGLRSASVAERVQMFAQSNNLLDLVQAEKPRPIANTSLQIAAAKLKLAKAKIKIAAMRRQAA